MGVVQGTGKLIFLVFSVAQVVGALGLIFSIYLTSNLKREWSGQDISVFLSSAPFRCVGGETQGRQTCMHACLAHCAIDP